MKFEARTFGVFLSSLDFVARWVPFPEGGVLGWALQSAGSLAFGSDWDRVRTLVAVMIAAIIGYFMSTFLRGMASLLDVCCCKPINYVVVLGVQSLRVLRPAKDPSPEAPLAIPELYGPQTGQEAEAETFKTIRGGTTTGNRGI